MEKENPRLYGLILAGGQSTRMGSDKGLLEYHGIPQRNHLFDLASRYCEKVFYSIRQDQIDEFLSLPIVVDQNNYRGPLNGILSAHDKYPEASWLVLACDLPLLDEQSIKLLVAERDLTKTATALASAESNVPEPLVAIWESEGLQKAKEYMNENSGPQKFLLHSDVKLVSPNTNEVLHNANSKEEFEQAKVLLKR